MQWVQINPRIVESATHRLRRAGKFMWLAERKAHDRERAMKIGETFPALAAAQAACEADAYRLATGR
jgi:hypothetical protein